MENISTEILEERLLEAVLYDEDTGRLHTPEERAENLDAIRCKLVEFGEIFDNMENMEMHTRLVFIPTFVRVVESYLKFVEKHEDLLEAGQ